jgi:UV excision repair protein RAD23
MPYVGGEGGLEQLRERIQQDPNYLQQLIQELQNTNPQMYQAMQEDPEGALQALLGGGEVEEEESQGIQVTEEEKAAIDRVRLM